MMMGDRKLRAGFSDFDRVRAPSYKTYSGLSALRFVLLQKMHQYFRKPLCKCVGQCHFYFRLYERMYLIIAFLLITLLCFTACSSREGAPQMTEATIESTTDKMDAFEMNKRLGRGVNLGNALEAPHEGEWGVTLQEEYFQLIADRGFDSVRIPIRWSSHASPDAPYTIDPSFFERVDWAVENALSRDLVAVINFHHYEEIFTDPRGHEERFLGLWQQVAKHYQDYPQELIFEILNEPHDKLNAIYWNQLLVKALNTIRETNPERFVIIGPPKWNAVNQLGYLDLPDEDRNIIVTFHYYEPYHFTHQGAEWAEGSDAWLGETWEGTDRQANEVILAMDSATAWAERNNRPLYMGEFGAYNKADIDSRVRWTATLAQSASERGISWAYWEFCSGFGIYEPDIKIWMNPLVDALLSGE
jgi:endoglucanase